MHMCSDTATHAQRYGHACAAIRPHMRSPLTAHEGRPPTMIVVQFIFPDCFGVNLYVSVCPAAGFKSMCDLCLSDLLPPSMFDVLAQFARSDCYIQWQMLQLQSHTNLIMFHVCWTSGLDIWVRPLGQTYGLDHWTRSLDQTTGLDLWARPLGQTSELDLWARPLGQTTGLDLWARSMHQTAGLNQ